MMSEKNNVKKNQNDFSLNYRKMVIIPLLSVGGFAYTQESKVGINTDNPQATLEISPSAKNAETTATTNEGILIPRLTKERVSKMATPAHSTLIYVSDVSFSSTDTKIVDIIKKGFYYYSDDAKKWIAISDIKYTGSASVAITNANEIQRAALTGDVTASANNNATTVAKIRGRNVATTAPTSGQVLKWNSTTNAWTPSADDNTNTTYTAGNGITLSGTEFSVPITTSGTGSVITEVSQNANGITVTKGSITDNDTKYTAGTGITLTGTEFSVPITTTGTGSYVQSINSTADGITVTKGTPPNTTYTAGSGMTLTGTQFSVPVATTGTGNIVTGVAQTVNGIEVTKGTLPDNDTTYTGSISVTLNNGSFQRAALTGDVTAAANNNATTVAKIQGRSVSNTAPTSGQVLKWNSTTNAWTPSSDDNTNTTYTAGNGITLSGTQFSVPITTSGTGSVITEVSQNANGITVTKGSITDNDTKYTAGTGITISGTNNAIAVNPAGVALGGDVTGNASANTVTKIQGRSVSNTAPTSGQVLKWNGTAWTPSSDDNTNTTYTAGNGITLSGTEFSVPITTSGTGSVITEVSQNADGITVTKGSITDNDTKYTGSSSVTITNANEIQRAALTGDVTAPANSNTTTIAPNAVTSAKIANGTILAEDLHSMGANYGQVIKYDGNQQKWVITYDQAGYFSKTSGYITIPCNKTYVEAVLGNGMGYFRCKLRDNTYKWIYDGLVVDKEGNVKKYVNEVSVRYPINGSYAENALQIQEKGSIISDTNTITLGETTYYWVTPQQVLYLPQADNGVYKYLRNNSPL